MAEQFKLNPSAPEGHQGWREGRRKSQDHLTVRDL